MIGIVTFALSKLVWLRAEPMDPSSGSNLRIAGLVVDVSWTTNALSGPLSPPDCRPPYVVAMSTV